MLRLAQAASSEFYSAWGVPPNQRRTGVTKDRPEGKRDGELNVIPFYGGWEFVFRAKDPEVREKIAWIMEGAVDNGACGGYGQNNGEYPRTGLFDLLEEMPYPDPRKIRNLFNCDCTSSCGASVYHAGVKDRRLRDMWSGNEREILMSTGSFVEITDPLMLELGTGLRRGDILLKTGHTAISIDDDDHRDSFPVKITRCYQSRVRSGPGTEYSTLDIVYAGKVLEALGTASDQDGQIWYRVWHDDMTGYTSAAYADPLPDGHCINDTWLRNEAGTDGKQIIVIPKGATVYLTGNKQDVQSGISRRLWYECIYGWHRGWASSLNIKE